MQLINPFATRPSEAGFSNFQEL